MEERTLSQCIKSIAWGYLFLHLNFNLGTLNILPNWWGYCLILGTFPILHKEEPSVKLLRPLGLILTFWEGVCWVAVLVGVSMDGFAWANLLITVLALYFHFQLLTNLAGIAVKYHCTGESAILHLRTIRTLLITLMALPIPWQKYEIAAVLLLVFNLIVAYAICSILFALAKDLAVKETTVIPHNL